MRKNWKRAAAAFAAYASLALLVVAVSGCGPGGTTTTGSTTATGSTGATATTSQKGPITVGSKIDVEGPLLGQMIIAMLEKNGFSVVDRTRTGATQVVRNALLSGQISVYPEYTANALLVFHSNQATDPAVLRDATKTYEAAKTLDLRLSNVVWLQPAPANNTWAVALTKKFASAHHLATMADWAAYIKKGGTVKIVGSQEFFTSAAAMPAFEKVYGFKLKSSQTLALGTGDTPVAEKAAAQGSNGANAAMAYGTDGTIAALSLVVLKDPLHAQPFYQPAPILMKTTADKYPEIATILDPVFAKLDLVTLQKLNGEIAVNGKDARTVARDWLTQQGFLK
jgi:osmoprotectant transport system substrate-binding protein